MDSLFSPNFGLVSPDYFFNSSSPQIYTVLLKPSISPLSIAYNCQHGTISKHEHFISKSAAKTLNKPALYKLSPIVFFCNFFSPINYPSANTVVFGQYLKGKEYRSIVTPEHSRRTRTTSGEFFPKADNAEHKTLANRSGKPGGSTQISSLIKKRKKKKKKAERQIFTDQYLLLL